VAAVNLIRLKNYELDGDNLVHNAESVFRSNYAAISKSPVALPLMTCAVDMLYSPVQQIVVVGEANAVDTKELLSIVHKVQHIMMKIALLS
jgi:uncharacterized protein YyaL (SSP411 family)